MVYDLICVGAGPTGLACAIEAKRAGMNPLVVDKGCLCNSLYHYPTNMLFFTTAERMEIGDLPMAIAGNKPTRAEALKYYRKATEHYGVDARLYEAVAHVERGNGSFRVKTRRANGITEEHQTRRVVIATGYYDLPKLLGVPGEDLPHVAHYFREAHPCWQRDVVIVGGQNSAAEAALDLFRAGARVMLVYRGRELSEKLKYWVRPDLENRIAAGEIQARFQTVVSRIETGRVVVRGTDGQAGQEEILPADFVFALTGYHPDFEFLRQQGIALDPETQKPVVNPETLETNVPGLYVAGVIVGGQQTNEIFIENGRFHGKQIVASWV
jgi:thioredoxin reductase (NADPH)